MTNKSANKMWGGRFAMSPAEVLQEINASIDFDKALAPFDVRASKVHAAMLGARGIISKDDARKIAAGLDRVLAEIEEGGFTFSRDLEDIHMNVEARLQQLVGPAAGRLHTARSRNDQVATDFRLYLRDWIDGADQALANLQLLLARKAEAHAELAMPGSCSARKQALDRGRHPEQPAILPVACHEHQSNRQPARAWQRK